MTERICSICLDNITPQNETHQTKCGHIFHKDCFNNFDNMYKKTTLKCPLCNEVLRVPKFDEDMLIQEINEYKEEWGELDCNDLIKTIELSYGKKFDIDKNKLYKECEKNKTIGGKNFTKKTRKNKKRKHLKNKSKKRRKTYRK